MGRGLEKVFGNVHVFEENLLRGSSFRLVTAYNKRHEWQTDADSVCANVSERGQKPKEVRLPFGYFVVTGSGAAPMPVAA